MTGSLTVGAIAQLAAGLSFAFVAFTLASRFSKGRDGSIVQTFAVFWAAMSLYMLQRGVLGLFADAGFAPFAVFRAASLVEITLLCLASWGMVSYVAFLYTGRRQVRAFAGAYYTLVGIAYLYATVAAAPERVVVAAWDYGLEPSTQMLDAIYLAFGVPMIVAILAYLSLVFQPFEPLQRYRVVLVSVSLLAWVVSGLAASLSGDSLVSFVAITVLGLVTAVAVFLAYRPPALVLRKLGAPPSDGPKAD